MKFGEGRFSREFTLFSVVLISFLMVSVPEAYAHGAAPLVISIETTTTTQIVITYDRPVTGTNIPAAWTVAGNPVVSAGAS